MTRKKRYFLSADENICYTRDYILEDFPHLDTVEVFEAIPYRDSNYNWCGMFPSLIDKSE